MPGLVAVALDGVLRAEIGAAPIPEGVELYHSLVTSYRVCVVLDEPESVDAALWLRKEGLRDYVQLHLRRPLDDRVMQYKRLQAVGPVGLVIDADPVAVAGAAELGIPAMCFVHPRMTRPEWRPDYEKTPRAWDELVARVEKTRLVGGLDTPP